MGIQQNRNSLQRNAAWRVVTVKLIRFNERGENSHRGMFQIIHHLSVLLLIVPACDVMSKKKKKGTKFGQDEVMPKTSSVLVPI